jgi:peptidoglycan/xylan/chitin deacetylase (PgdA/CDA1 family)
VIARATVIVYHGLGRCPATDDPYRMFTPVEKFAREMRFLARFCKVVPLDDVVAGRIPHGRPTVAITFDDGYASVLEHAVPVLHRYGFVATCFVPTYWIGRQNGWDTFTPSDCPLPILDADGLRALDAAGVAVESHGHRHAPLGEIPAEDAATDIATSREVLAGVLGRPPRFLAYPYGSQSAAARAAAEAAGFAAAFSIGQRDAGPFGRERVTIRPTDPMALFAFKTSGVYLATRNSRLGEGVMRVIRPAVLARRAKGP